MFYTRFYHIISFLVSLRKPHSHKESELYIITGWCKVFDMYHINTVPILVYMYRSDGTTKVLGRAKLSRCNLVCALFWLAYIIVMWLCFLSNCQEARRRNLGAILKLKISGTENSRATLVLVIDILYVSETWDGGATNLSRFMNSWFIHGFM